MRRHRYVRSVNAFSAAARERRRNTEEDLLIRVDWKFFTSSGISRFLPVTSINSGGWLDFFTFTGWPVSSSFFLSLVLGFTVVVVVFVVVVVIGVVVVVSGNLIVTDSFFSTRGSSSTVGSFLGVDVFLVVAVVVPCFSVALVVITAVVVVVMVVVGGAAVVTTLSVVTTVDACWLGINGPVDKPRCAYKARMSGCRDTATIPPAIATTSKVTVLWPAGSFAGFSFRILSRKLSIPQSNDQDLHGIDEISERHIMKEEENNRSGIFNFILSVYPYEEIAVQEKSSVLEDYCSNNNSLQVRSSTQGNHSSME